MKTAFPLLASIALAACTAASDSDPATDGAPSDSARADSTVVVASGPRVPSEKGPRVVFLGTSLTAGLGLDDPARSWVGQLDALADSAGAPIEAVNAGVSGDTSAGGVRRLDWLLREPLDVLVVELGANDGLRGHDPEALRHNLTEIIQRTRARYPDAGILLAGMEAPPNLGERYTSAFREVFPEVARAEGVDLVPFLLEGVAGVAELNQDDRIHPTSRGHRIMAETVWPYLEPLVREASDS